MLCLMLLNVWILIDNWWNLYSRLLMLYLVNKEMCSDRLFRKLKARKVGFLVHWSQFCLWKIMLMLLMNQQPESYLCCLVNSLNKYSLTSKRHSYYNYFKWENETTNDKKSQISAWLHVLFIWTNTVNLLKSS